MPAIDRPLSGDVLVFDLPQERERAAAATAGERSSRQARTLLKAGPLRVTLVVLEPGGEIAEHHAEGPITIQVTEGSIQVAAAGHEHRLRVGQLLAAGPGVSHRVTSPEGGAFLLTVVQPGAAAAH